MITLLPRSLPSARWIGPALLCAIPGRAVAEAGLNGSTGVLSVPSHQTTEWGGIQTTFGMQASRAGEVNGVGGVPAGLAMGMGAKTEVGVRVEREPWDTVIAVKDLGRFGAHYRRRVIDPEQGQAGHAVQATIHALDSLPTTDLLYVVGWNFRRGTFGTAVGPGVDFKGRDASGSRMVPFGWGGAGLEFYSTARSRVLLEAAGGYGAEGLREMSSRLGFRWVVRQRVLATVWGGGGQGPGTDALPLGESWYGGGLQIGLYSEDPTATDRDFDAIPDWDDRCRYEAEDLDGWEDEDGCPEADNDQDGIPDELDPTPDGENAEDLSFPTSTPQLKQIIKTRPLPKPIEPKKRPGAPVPK